MSIFHHKPREAAIRFRRKHYVTSASALDVFVNDCERKWFFERLERVPRTKLHSEATGFGTVLHSVIERYMLADDRGYADGEAVDLYPPGWHIVREYNRDLKRELTYELPIELQDRLQSLVQHGIESGVLLRLPRRKVEAEFWAPVVEASALSVYVMGYVDLLGEDRIEDHKNIGRARYRKGKGSLQKDLQLLCYAKVLLEQRRAKGLADPPKIWIAWNQFVREEDNLSARKIEVGLAPAKIDEHWEEVIVPAARKMGEIAAEYRVNGSYDWKQLPVNTNSCRKYGGCPLVPVCGNAVTLEVFKNRALKKLRTSVGSEEPEKPTNKEVTPVSMSFAERLALQNKARAAATSVPKAEPEKPKVETPPAATEDKPSGQAAPWAADSCRACRMNASANEKAIRGVRSNGDPCPICDTIQIRLKGPRAEQFDYEVKDGVLSWTAKDGTTGSAGTPTDNTVKTETVTVAEPQAEEPEFSEVAASIEDLEPGTFEAMYDKFGDAVRMSDTGAVEVLKDRLAEIVAAMNDFTLDLVAKREAREKAEKASKPEKAEKASKPADVTEEIASAWRLPAGRPRATFTLLRGCMAMRGFTKTRRFSEVFEWYALMLAEDTGKSSFYELDPFGRRDALCSKAAEMAEELKGYAILTQAKLTPDMEALYQALAPLASMEVISTNA